MDRRHFIKGAAAVIAATAPAVSVMAAPTIPTLWCDGIHCDAEALEAIISGRDCVDRRGPVPVLLRWNEPLRFDGVHMHCWRMATIEAVTRPRAVFFWELHITAHHRDDYVMLFKETAGAPLRVEHMTCVRSPG